MTNNELIKELTSYEFKKEWFEFKVNRADEDEIGSYISAISNSCAIEGRDYGYLVWGIEDKTHKIVGTQFNYDSHTKSNEPLIHYLERQLSPRINIEFSEFNYQGKRLVNLKIAAAHKTPTAWKNERYIRVGSSKEKLMKFPERERKLFWVLIFGHETIQNTKANTQDLTFNKLFGFYGSKGIQLKEETFRQNLGFYTEKGEYNLLAQLLSDNSGFPVRVSIFGGYDKTAPLYTVDEFGFTNLLYTLDDLIRFGNVVNIYQADERNRVLTRKEVPLFDSNVYKEAIINAILHNKWTSKASPMISIFKDRIEIDSMGNLGPEQTIEGFYKGESKPVNEKLAEIFLQLRISEKSGRGVPAIVKVYGKEAIYFGDGFIKVTIPFNRIDAVKFEIEVEEIDEETAKLILNQIRKKILSEIIKNPRITKALLAEKLNLSTTAIDNNIDFLKKHGFIKRVGANKNGYWKALRK